MASPISPRAVAYVRGRATAVMTYRVRIERVRRPSYATDSLVGTPGSRTTIYEGRCRIYEATSSGSVVVGQNDIALQSTQLSIPWDTTPVPKKDDQGEILECDDPDMVGRRFEILDVARSGAMRATRRFTIQYVQDKV